MIHCLARSLISFYPSLTIWTPLQASTITTSARARASGLAFKRRRDVVAIRMRDADLVGCDAMILYRRTFLIGLATLAACATGEKATQLREGMTQAEVEAILGRPDGYQHVGDYVGYQYTNRLISGWSWDKADYFAIFNKGRLTQWGPGQVRPGNGPNVGTLIVIPIQ